MHRRRGARTSKRTTTRRTTSTVRTQAPRNSNRRWRVRRNSNSLPLFRTQPPMSDSKSDIHTHSGTEKIERPSRNSNTRAEIRTDGRSPSRLVTLAQRSEEHTSELQSRQYL